MKQRDGLVLDVTEPGEYELSGDGVLDPPRRAQVGVVSGDAGV